MIPLHLQISCAIKMSEDTWLGISWFEGEISLTGNTLDWFLTTQWNISLQRTIICSCQLAIQRSVYTHLVISSCASSSSWHIVNSYSCGTVMASSNLSKTESHLSLELFCESSKFNILVHNICNKWTKVDTMHSRVWGISALMNASLHRNLAKVWLEVHMKSLSDLHCHRRQKHFIKYPILRIMDQSIIVSSSLEIIKILGK